MRAVIVGSGILLIPGFLKSAAENADVIIAADGGGLYLYGAGIIPDLLVGDFDSIPPAVLDYFQRSKAGYHQKLPGKKDFTDTELAGNRGGHGSRRDLYSVCHGLAAGPLCREYTDPVKAS